ncbi:MAG: hypothetical protein JW838_08210 [Spirochaetes bacterium]|nr:hypothetical protein [Spirochaetota bacterium]
MEAKQQMRVIALLQLITAAGLALFWVGFFTVGLAPENAPSCYMAYERAFPLPDGILACAMAWAGISLLRGRGPGRLFTHASAGALMFLGVLDFSFNIQNGIYALSALDLALNGFINAWCVGFGIAAIAVTREG